MNLKSILFKIMLFFIVTIFSVLGMSWRYIQAQVNEQLDTLSANDNNNNLSWRERTEIWLNPYKPRVPKGPEEICLILPLSSYNHRNTISQNPLFAWENGDAFMIEVRENNTKEIVWQYNLALGQNRVIYNTDGVGETLQFGQTYEWILFDQQGNPLIKNNRNQPYYSLFSLFDEITSNHINNELEVIKNSMINSNTESEIAFAQFQYLLELDSDLILGSDAFQIVLSVENPSVKLQEEVIDQIINNYCD
jgi:hypothetical protein